MVVGFGHLCAGVDAVGFVTSERHILWFDVVPGIKKVVFSPEYVLPAHV
jgi:hypothetical protein